MNSRCLATAICVIGMSISGAAECVYMQGILPAQKRAATYVFDGTVTRVEHVAADGTRTNVDHVADLALLMQPRDNYMRVYAATMEVHRVWKGDTSKQITVYFVPNVDGPNFSRGSRKVVFAHRQTEQIRKTLSIDPSDPPRDAWVLPCSGVRWDDKKSLQELGQSRKPSVP